MRSCLCLLEIVFLISGDISICQFDVSQITKIKKMYLIVIAWLYVTLMMALAEAFSTQGSVLGAIITFVLYGVLPMGLVVYLMGTPLRHKARKQAEASMSAPQPSTMSVGEPDASGHAPGLPEDASVTPVRKEP
jgi:ABC-type transport system involved in cytochrome c biogenesis permease subunit